MAAGTDPHLPSEGRTGQAWKAAHLRSVLEGPLVSCVIRFPYILRDGKNTPHTQKLLLVRARNPEEASWGCGVGVQGLRAGISL